MEEENGVETNNGEILILDRQSIILQDETHEDIMEEWVNCDEDVLNTSDVGVIQLTQDENNGTNDVNEQD